METRANYLLIGAVTLFGFIGLLGFLMWFAKVEVNRQFDYYDVLFPAVSGLSRASEVRFSGLSVGQVLDMQLMDENGLVRVRLEVAKDTPIREGARASLETQGVTGVAVVAIRAGNPDAPLLRDTAAIPEIPAAPSALQTLSDQGPEIIARLNTVAEQLSQLLGEENQARVANILDNVERSSGNLDQAIADITAVTSAIGDTAGAIAGFGAKVGQLSDAAQGTLEHADTALERFSSATETAQDTLSAATAALGELRSYIAGELRALTARFDALTDRAGTSLDGIDTAMDSAGRAFDSAGEVIGRDIAPVTASLRESLGGFDETMRALNRDLPGILDHIRNAANAADSAFASLRSLSDGARAPVQSFTRDGLVQFTAVARDARNLVDNLNQLVTALRRNPAQVITGPRQPEFRR